MTPSIYWLPLTEEQVIAKEKEKADNEKKRIQDREARKDEPRRNVNSFIFIYSLLNIIYLLLNIIYYLLFRIVCHPFDHKTVVHLHVDLHFVGHLDQSGDRLLEGIHLVVLTGDQDRLKGEFHLKEEVHPKGENGSLTSILYIN